MVDGAIGAAITYILKQMTPQANFRRHYSRKSGGPFTGIGAAPPKTSGKVACREDRYRPAMGILGSNAATIPPAQSSR